MQVEYQTVFSNKRKTISLVVERDKTIKVYAPEGTSEEKLKSAIDNKRFWLYQKINSEKKITKKPISKEFVNGESFLYLGRNYQLELVESEEDIKFLNRFYLSKEKKSVAKDIFEQWYKEKAKEKMVPVVNEFAQKMGVSFKAIKFTKMNYQWGSCSVDGVLNFNHNIIKAPRFVIEYVVVHELAHLIELNHSDKFWSVVKVQLPKYQVAKKWLITDGKEIE